MKTPKTRLPGTRRERCARWLGLDHNPLRRPADRAEAWLRLLMIALILTVVPVTAIGCGLVANQVFARQARAEHRADHLVSAVLIEPTAGSAIDPYVADPETFVQARWTAPDGVVRTGQILAPAGAPAGRIIRIWVNDSGVTVDSPSGHTKVVTGAALVGVTSGLMLILMLVLLQAAARRMLDRQRLAAWDTEWRGTGPLWTGRHS